MVGRAGVDTGPFRLAVEAIQGELEAPQAGVPAPPGSDPPPFYNLFDLALAALQVEVCDRTGDPDAGPGRARSARGSPPGRLRVCPGVGGLRA